MLGAVIDAIEAGSEDSCSNHGVQETVVKISGTIPLEKSLGSWDEFSFSFGIGAQGLPKDVKGVEDGGGSPSCSHGNAHVHTDGIGKKGLKKLPCFVVDELVRKEAEDPDGVTFPEGPESLLLGHGGDAVTDGGVILVDFASLEEFLGGLESQFDDLDGVGGGENGCNSRSLSYFSDVHLIFYGEINPIQLIRSFLTKTKPSPHTFIYPPFLFL